MRVKRRILGQHFLNSLRFAERIAQIAHVENNVVLEIGSGKGIITRQLAERSKKVIAVEIDPRLARCLEDLELPRVSVINGDFLKIDLGQWPKSIVVGNIPYSITSSILRKLADNKERMQRAVLTVQKEYAAKIMAPVGDSKYGYWAIHADYHFEVHREFNIPARYFSPRPKVSSAVLTLKPKKSRFGNTYETELFEFIAGVFRYRRKSMKNAIFSHGRVLPGDLDDARLKQRPQHLSFDDYHQIYSMIIRA
jgi:16S rRNA (adenine1518-N6/adenine1519-N6)-dimethyltransferase